MDQEVKDPIVTITYGYINEAKEGRRKRMLANERNLDVYHLRQDWSHKMEGQSREFLARQQTATDQLVSFLTQGLIDLGLWFSISNTRGGQDSELLSNLEMAKILKSQLEKNDFYYRISDALQVGALQSLMVMKVGGDQFEKSSFVVKVNDNSPSGKELQRVEKTIWDLCLDLVRPEDYYPDPTARGLYEGQRIVMDKHELLHIASNHEEDYDIQAIENLNYNADGEQKARKARETNQSIPVGSPRNEIEIYEFQGDIVDGNGKLLHKDVCWAVSEGSVIKKPTKIKWWHGKRQFIVAPISRVAFSVWHRALMDAASVHNEALNEVYNLMFDGGMMAAFGIRQIRTDWLEDPTQVSGGIGPGISLKVNSNCPPGGLVMEPVQVTNLGREAFEMFSITDREFQQSALTNDVRLGSLPERNVKATEIVASNQSLSGMFKGVVKGIEEKFLAPMLEMAWSNVAQNLHNMDFDDLVSVLGEQRAQEVLSVPIEEIYAATAQGKKYKVFGLSGVINKINDFRKISQLLQTIGGVPELYQEFKKKYSFPKLMAEVIKSLDIDEDKFTADENEMAEAAQEKAFQQQLELMKAQGKNTEGSPNAASQIGQMSNTTPESGVDPDRAGLNMGSTNS